VKRAAKDDGSFAFIAIARGRKVKTAMGEEGGVKVDGGAT